MGEAAAGGLQASDLYDRLRYLQRTRDVVSLPEAIEWLHRREGAIPNRPAGGLAVITFDDGYRDNLTNLLPVLQSAEAPATIFVATEPIVEGGYLWFDRARSALQQATDAELAALRLEWLQAAREAPDRRHLREAVLNHLKRSAPAQRREHLADLLAALPAARPEPEQQMMTPAELRSLAADPHVTIGAHTHSHQILACCDLEQAAAEMDRNLQALQELTGTVPTCFAYPNGRAGDFSAATAQVLRDRGITAAVTTLPELNMPGAELLALGRQPLGEAPIAGFAWQVDCRSA